MRANRQALVFSAAALASAAAIGTARGMDETRRQVGSASIDAVFNLTGNGINIGQEEASVPTAHTDVTGAWYTPRTATEGTDLHALQVAGVMVSRNATYAGMAPAANLFSDNLFDNAVPAGGGGTADDNNWLDSIRWLSSRSVRVINASVRLGDAANANSKAALGTDWLIANGTFLFVKSSGNKGTNTVNEPGLSFNCLNVGAVTNEDYQAGTTISQGPVNRRWNVVANFSQYDGSPNITKPDIVAPGGRVDTDTAEVGFTMAHDTPANSFSANAGASFVGTSYAAPHVAGIAAQLYQFAPLTDYRAMKAVLMNSADTTVRGCQHEAAGGAHGIYYRQLDPPWTPGNHGLDQYSGAGMVDAWGAAANLIAGPGNGRIGVTSGTMNNGGGASDVVTLNTGPDSRIVATVVWDRAVDRTAPAAGAGIETETFAAAANQPHFSIGYSGPVSFTQNSAGGSVQHINAVVDQAGAYKIQINNNGAAGGRYSVAWAVSPPDVNPGTQTAFFTVRDQIHRPRAERTAPAGNDRILEGRPTSTLNSRAIGDSLGIPVGVESSIYKTSMDASTFTYRTGLEMGLTEAAGVNPDDHVNDISFGRDNVRRLRSDGGKVWFSVDAFATGLSPIGVDNPETGVYSEATIVHEAAGDVFQSNTLLRGGDPITNQNRKIKNNPNADYLHPQNNLNNNTTWADSYYLGMTGPRVADHEDDLTGLEGLGQSDYDPSTPALQGDFIFFSLDRGSPSTLAGGKKTGNIYVHKVGTNDTKLYASASQLGLQDTDCIDGLLVQHLSGLKADGFPVYDPRTDFVVFSVDRDSAGAALSAVTQEAVQGEMPGDLFYANPDGSNDLFLEATDLGLQEIALGNSRNWLSDNLDALDVPDMIPEPATGLLACAALAGLLSRRRIRPPAGPSPARHSGPGLG